MVNRLQNIIRAIKPKKKRVIRPQLVGKPQIKRKGQVVLTRSGLQTRGTPQQQAGAIFKTPTPKKTISIPSKRRGKAKKRTVTVTREPSGVVTLAPRDKGSLGLAGISQKLQTERGRLRTRKQLDKIGTFEELNLAALTVGSSVVDFSKGVVDLPSNVMRIIKNPSLLKDVPIVIEKEGRKFGELIRVSPTEAFVRIGTELVLLQGFSKGLKTIGNVGERTTARLSPSFVGKAKKGSTLTIKTGAGKSVKLKVIGTLPGEKVSRQVKRAGKVIPKAISSQADNLLGIIKREKTIRKPIPGEANFTPLTKTLLNKFDKKNINKKELIALDNLIQRQGGKGLLERSFFADPSGKIRPSRLGREAKTNLLDILGRDVTFRKPKPQILLFQDIKVQQFPKNLKGVANKLKKGKQLTKKESNLLLEFQLKKSGKFKPLGFVSKESEITLAPGEILKRTKKVGVTIINGRKVPIIKTEIFKPKGRTKTLIKKFEKNKLTPREAKALDKLLKKQTGFNYGITSSKQISRKFVSIKRVGISTLVSTTKKSKKAISKPISRKVSLKKSKIKPSVSRKDSAVSPKRRVSPISRVRKVSPPKISPLSKRSLKKGIKKVEIVGASKSKSPQTAKLPIIIPRIKKVKRFKKKIRKEGWIIKEKQGGKFIKLKGKPLSKQDAKDKLAFFLDNRISRTAKLIRVGKVKKLGKIKKRERGAFRRNKRNLREFRIVKGRRVKTPNTFIERKGKGVINTAGEKRQLRLNRLAKARKKR